MSAGWPSNQEMKGLGHGITKLDGLCRQHLRAGLIRAIHPGYAQSLLVQVERSRALPHLLLATERYARGGRVIEQAAAPAGRHVYVAWIDPLETNERSLGGNQA